MHFKTKYKSHASGPAIGQPHIVCTCFWLEKARYIWFCLLCLAFNCFWWIGIDNGRSISNCSRFQSCSYANDVATMHVVYNRIVSECDHENNQSTHICIYEPYQNSKLLPIKILEAILLILFCTYHPTLIPSCLFPKSGRGLVIKGLRNSCSYFDQAQLLMRGKVCPPRIYNI